MGLLSSSRGCGEGPCCPFQPPGTPDVPSPPPPSLPLGSHGTLGCAQPPLCVPTWTSRSDPPSPGSSPDHVCKDPGHIRGLQGPRGVTPAALFPLPCVPGRPSARSASLFCVCLHPRWNISGTRAGFGLFGSASDLGCLDSGLAPSERLARRMNERVHEGTPESASCVQRRLWTEEVPGRGKLSLAQPPDGRETGSRNPVRGPGRHMAGSLAGGAAGGRVSWPPAPLLCPTGPWGLTEQSEWGTEISHFPWRRRTWGPRSISPLGASVHLPSGADLHLPLTPPFVHARRQPRSAATTQSCLWDPAGAGTARSPSSPTLLQGAPWV